MKYRGYEIKKGIEYYVSETSISGTLEEVKKMIDKRKDSKKIKSTLFPNLTKELNKLEVLK